MSYKQEQKELKRPDELQKLGQQALPWMETHGRTVVYGVLGVGVLGLIIAIFSHLSEKAELNASASFGAALSVLDREVNATGAAKAGEEPPFKNEDEKDQEIINKLTNFRQQHSGQKAAVNAALPLAQALLRKGKADEAMPLIEEYLKGSDQSDPLRPSAFEARGYALEEQKKYDEAIGAFEQLSRENKTDFLKGMGLYHRARMLQLKGDLNGAAKQLSEIDAAAPNSAASKLAKDRMALLASQGVAIPTVAPVAAALDAGM
jgi:tetratricopeptide (TPR) repeat protein